MYILQGFTLFSFLAQFVFAQQPTPILPDPKLTPGETFHVTAQDVCVPGYAKRVRAVPAWLSPTTTYPFDIREATQYAVCVPPDTGRKPRMLPACRPGGEGLSLSHRSGMTNLLFL
jgi:hypothetical protein